MKMKMKNENESTNDNNNVVSQQEENKAKEVIKSSIFDELDDKQSKRKNDDDDMDYFNEEPKQNIKSNEIQENKLPGKLASKFGNISFNPLALKPGAVPPKKKDDNSSSASHDLMNTDIVLNKATITKNSRKKKIQKSYF